MSDSIDRVFSHALNTVNKIRTGSEKPPSSIRLKLYGLYKQSMEGDVEGIMDRPEGNDPETQRAREKWDAWKAQTGLSRTEAKRRYISTLISTMHRYASPSPEARELVAELEFVWDQVKSNVPSSSSSSPLQTLGVHSVPGLHNPPTYPTLSGDSEYVAAPGPREPETPSKRPMRILSPVSRGPDDKSSDDAIDVDAEDTAAEDEAEFVDAQDSQYNPHEIEAASHVQNEPQSSKNPSPASPATDAKRLTTSVNSSRDAKWRRRVEAAMEKMTAEVAALREQLESRRLFSYSRRHTLFAWVRWIVVGIFKVFVVDLVMLGIVLIWMRKKKDRRLEGAVRVLLGDAVAQVQKVGAGIRMPALGPSKRSKGTQT